MRQEVVLTDKQDFYAQAKREDGGIVFYTGLNSNGDLYIGNKKVNAITGEETFLESAELVDSEDEDEDIGTLVTTFDSPVTFNSTITVAGKSTLNGPVEINVEASEGDALRVISNIGSGDDPTLFNGSWRTQSDGDIVIAKNQIKAAVFYLNARPKPGAQYGQSYTWRTNYLAGEPSNIVPWQETNFFYPSQEVSYGGNEPESGDIIYKGSSIGQSGSLGWILTNQFKSAETSVQTISADGTQNLTITWIATETNGGIGIKGNSTIRITNFSNPVVNGTYQSLTGMILLLLDNKQSRSESARQLKMALSITGQTKMLVLIYSSLFLTGKRLESWVLKLSEHTLKSVATLDWVSTL